MYLMRKGLLAIDNTKMEGHWFKWDELKVKKFCNLVIPKIYTILSSEKKLNEVCIVTFGPEKCRDNPDWNYHRGMVKNDELETYLLKHFAERYSAILYVINHIVYRSCYSMMSDLF